METVALARPSYKLGRDDRAEVGKHASRLHRIAVCQEASSLGTACNCNRALAKALNQRQSAGFGWFAILHDDVFPEAGWLDLLIDVATRRGADAISAVVPIKDDSGHTSTALAYPTARGFRRLTQAQVRHPAFPDTFDLTSAAQALELLPEPYGLRDVPRMALWINTGCFVCRLDRDWDWSKVCFAMYDGLERTTAGWRPYNMPEDWLFAQRIAEAGGKVMATRLVRLIHRSDRDFASDAVWGQSRDCD